MSDLISRSALLKHMDKKWNYWKSCYSFADIMEDIETAPCAYNVDKVVQQLEEKLSKKHKLFLRGDRDEIKYFYEIQMLKEVIEIVRKGGVDHAEPESPKPEPPWKQAFLRTFLGRNEGI